MLPQFDQNNSSITCAMYNSVMNISRHLLLLIAVLVFVMYSVSFTGLSPLISHNALECTHIGDYKDCL